MTEAEWLTHELPMKMLHHLRARLLHRKLRLLAIAYFRAAEDEILDPRSRLAVETAEKYVEGTASEEELALAETAAREAYEELTINYGEEKCWLEYAAEYCAWRFAFRGAEQVRVYPES